MPDLISRLIKDIKATLPGFFSGLRSSSKRRKRGLSSSIKKSVTAVTIYKAGFTVFFMPVPSGDFKISYIQHMT